ncbi:MAG TPA: ComEC/Rec2 family competence protein, partial [Motilibacterales bacterium]|nr:ComEC/Rec2 family competence protein [Motilibacterales bacterium]
MSASDHRPAADPARAPAEGDQSSGRAGPDLRLAPLVMALWVGEAAILLTEPVQPVPWALGGALVVLAALLGAVVLGRRPVQPAALPVDGTVLVGFLLRVTRTHRIALLVGLCGFGLGVALAAGHLMRLHPPVLQGAAQQGAVLQAEATITGDPVVQIPADDGGRPMSPSWSVQARLSALAVRGRTYSVRAPVLLRGDQVALLRYGSRVALSGRAQESWTPERQSLTLNVLGTVHIRSPPGPVARVTTRIREAFRAACSGLPVDAGALLLGLAVGDESTLPADLDEAMVRAGLAHLTAVSGSNTSLVVAIAMAAVAGLGLGWRARVTTCLAVLGAYVMLVRPQPSVLRAAAMGVVALVALSTGGRRRGPPALLAAALVLLVVLPQFALSLGFALSFAATAGLLVVGPPIADRLGRWPATRRTPEPIRAALAVAAAAHLATLPLGILMGNGASLVALPANVVVTPLVPIATVLGLAAALVAPIAPAPAALLATLAAPATATIAWVARASAGLPFGVMDVPAGPVGAVGSAVMLALLVAAAARGWRPWRDRRVVLTVALAGVLGVVLTQARVDRWPPPDWVVLACDVGQGDGLLIREPGSGEALLVDAGPEPAAIVDCLVDSG